MDNMKDMLVYPLLLILKLVIYAKFALFFPIIIVESK